MRHHTLTSTAIAAALVGSLVALPGCRGDRSNKPPRQFFPDMDDSPKFKPQSQNPFFEDHRAMRPVVAGTVPFGRWDVGGGLRDEEPRPWLGAFTQERSDLLKDDDRIYRGVQSYNADGAPTYVEAIPIPVDQALIARGQERFGIYCAVCHGYYGRGEGMVGQRWTGQTVANFHDPKYSDPNEPDQKGKDGFIFHTAMNGVWDPNSGAQKMPPYNHALSTRDAWAVVAYVRVLQAAQTGNLDDVPYEARQRVQDALAKLPPPPPPPAAPGATNPPAGQQPETNVPSGAAPQPTPPTPPETPAPEGNPR